MNNRFNDKGEIYCRYNKHYVSTDDINIKDIIDGKIYYQTYCKKCILEYNKVRKQKIDAGEHTVKPTGKKIDYLRINENPEDMAEMKKVLSSIGYDINENIHEQFMKKYKFLIDNPKWI